MDRVAETQLSEPTTTTHAADKLAVTAGRHDLAVVYSIPALAEKSLVGDRSAGRRAKSPQVRK